MANRHSATHQGFTFTRTSANRTYSHAVLVQEDLAEDRKRAERNGREYFRINASYWRELAGGVHESAQRFPGQYTPERIATDIAEAQAKLDMGEAGHADASLARFDARQAAKPTKTLADGRTYFTCAGWCGREDLARKLASSAGGFIVPAVVK